MVNAWNHPSVISAEALMHLEDALVIAPLAARDKTGEFVNKPMKIGQQVDIRTQPEYEAKEFTNNGTNTVEKQAIRDSTRPFIIEKLYDVSVEITNREKVLDLDSFSEQVIIPAAWKLAEQVDIYLGTKILEGAGLYPSTDLLATAADVALARKTSTEQQLSGNRFALVDLDTEAKLLGQTWFNQSQTRGAPGISTLQSAQMGMVMGMNFVSSINFPNGTSHTFGTASSTTDNTVATDNLIGLSTLTVDAMGAGILTAGDRLHIAGVRRPLKVKTAVPDTTLTTAIDLVDPITEVIPDGAAVTVVGDEGTNVSYVPRGAIFDDSSLAIAMPPLGAPSDKPSSTASNNGYSIRVVQGYDIEKKVEVMSMDLMVGATCWDPRKVTLLGDVTTS